MSSNLSLATVEKILSEFDLLTVVSSTSSQHKIVEHQFEFEEEVRSSSAAGADGGVVSSHGTYLDVLYTGSTYKSLASRRWREHMYVRRPVRLYRFRNPPTEGQDLGRNASGPRFVAMVDKNV